MQRCASSVYLYVTWSQCSETSRSVKGHWDPWPANLTLWLNIEGQVDTMDRTTFFSKMAHGVWQLILLLAAVAKVEISPELILALSWSLQKSAFNYPLHLCLHCLLIAGVSALSLMSGNQQVFGKFDSFLRSPEIILESQRGQASYLEK